MTPLFLRFVVMVFRHDTTPRTGFPPQLSATREPPEFPQMCTNIFLKHLQVLERFTFPLSHSFPRGIDVTENPLSKCEIGSAS